ncbi:hypothetical protein AOLI_G00221640 [Acnodon oligacanthus]
MGPPVQDTLRGCGRLQTEIFCFKPPADDEDGRSRNSVGVVGPGEVTEMEELRSRHRLAVCREGGHGEQRQCLSCCSPSQCCFIPSGRPRK